MGCDDLKKVELDRCGWKYWMLTDGSVVTGAGPEGLMD